MTFAYEARASLTKRCPDGHGIQWFRSIGLYEPNAWLNLDPSTTRVRGELVLISKSNLPLAAPQLTIQALDNIPLIPRLVWFTFPIRLATSVDEEHTLLHSDSSPRQKSTPVLVLRTSVFAFMDFTFVDCSTMRSTLSWFSHQSERSRTNKCRTTRVHLCAAWWPALHLSENPESTFPRVS